jgi:hypothetical protein
MPMESRVKNCFLCAAAALLAACQSPSANQATRAYKPAAATGQSGDPSSRYEVDSFGPFQREPGIGLRGQSFFGRGP